ncbi:unnamed protein product, partial [Discosporangium mesarthrocarpum]
GSCSFSNGSTLATTAPSMMSEATMPCELGGTRSSSGDAPTPPAAPGWAPKASGGNTRGFGAASGMASDCVIKDHGSLSSGRGLGGVGGPGAGKEEG